VSQRKYTTEQEKEAVALRKRGISLKQIQEKTRLNKVCVKRICSKAGIKLSPEQILQNHYLPFTQETKNNAIRLRETGIAIPIISEQLKIPRNTLKGWFAKLSLTIPKEKRWENRDQAITPESYARSAEKRSGPKSSAAKKAAQNYNSIQERYVAIAIKNGGKYLGPQEWFPSNQKVRWSCQKDHEFEMSPSSIIGQDSWCPRCAKGASKGEAQVFDLVKSLCPDATQRERTILKPYEIDVLIPSKNIGIEYSGLHWHGELRNKDKFNVLRKHLFSNSKKIRLITIFEDEWINHQLAVENYLKGVLGTRGRIGARKLTIKKGKFKAWVEENHLQGAANGIDYALFDKDTLLAVATFAKPNASRARKGTNGTWELSRYCVGQTGITGGLSRLIKAFKTDYPEAKELISYSDNRWSQGKIYESTGFTRVRQNRPSYWYFTHRPVRIHRFSLRKDILVKQGGDPSKTEWQLAQEKGYDRIWDAGTTLWSKLL
jgi:hypothetical protein